LVLINPNARRGSDGAGQARALLQHQGLQLVEPDGDGKDLSDTIRRHAERVDCVVVGGGDGSLNGAVQGLLDTGLPLGVLPLGTANDFARSVGIPFALEGAAEAIGRGRLGRVDLGVANGYPYFNVASIGFSAELAASLTAENKKRWGKLGYAITAARLLAGSSMFRAAIEHDGEVERFKTFQVSVGNGRFYGGGMTVHSDASPMDGLLDCYSLEVDHWWKLLRLLPALRRGTHGQWQDVRAFSSKRLVVDTDSPRPVNLDGELKTHTPVRFELLEQALPVYLP